VITNLLLIWLAIGVALMLIGIQDGRSSAGMPLAYFLGLSLIHTPGAAIFLGAPRWGPTANQTLVGFEQTVIGLVAFLVGVMVVRFGHFAARPAQKPNIQGLKELAILDRLSLIYASIGIFCFVFGSILSIPSVGAIIAQLNSLVIVGACLRLWVARQERDGGKLWISMLCLPLLPIITLIRGGFFGTGVGWLLTILSFVVGQSKRRLVYFLAAPFFIYFGLSVFVNYMASREEFRKAAWIQQVGIGDRVQRTVDMFSNFQWYDSDNPKQRGVINGRLNQNLLVGAAVERLELGIKDYAYGQTLVDALIGLVPRAVWPDKPQVGGGGTVAEDFAGIRVAAGTSVGAGQVLEFYANFGLWGVIGGFLIYGGLIGWMDLRIAGCLNQGDQKGFLLWFLLCMALMQPQGNLLEIVVTAAASGAAALALNYLVTQRLTASLRARGPTVNAKSQRSNDGARYTIVK
jgi:hypothetical protein